MFPLVLPAAKRGKLCTHKHKHTHTQSQRYLGFWYFCQVQVKVEELFVLKVWWTVFFYNSFCWKVRLCWLDVSFHVCCNRFSFLIVLYACSEKSSPLNSHFLDPGATGTLNVSVTPHFIQQFVCFGDPQQAGLQFVMIHFHNLKNPQTFL